MQEFLQWVALDLPHSRLALPHTEKLLSSGSLDTSRASPQGKFVVGHTLVSATLP
jgi:hypothetical protein